MLQAYPQVAAPQEPLCALAQAEALLRTVMQRAGNIRRSLNADP